MQTLRLTRFAYLLSALLAVLPHMPAQDIVVSGPMLFPSDTEVDTPPVLKKAWKLKCPEAMKKETEHAYAFVSQYTDANGKRLSRNQHGAQPLVELINAEISGLQCQPAQADGKPVASRFLVAIIFNPAGASPKAADAEPRLLAVMPAFISQKRAAELRKAKQSAYIKVAIELDASGSLSSYALSPKSSYAEPFKAEIDAALARWKFAPARKGGQPVASSLEALVLLIHENALVQSPSTGTPPSVVHRDPPVYPRAMKKSGLIGEVTISFVVDKKGDVTNPVVVRSNNPGFEEAAIEAVLKWKFKPGIKDGKPVNTRMQVPIIFHLDGGGRDLYEVDQPSKKQIAKMPEGLRYDTPPEPRGVIHPVYPYALYADKAPRGSATLSMLIDPQGRVVMAKVLEATRPEFGESGRAAVEHFEFKPATLEGKPVAGVLKTEFNFDPHYDDTGLYSMEMKKSDRIAGAGKLDSVPKALSQRKPVFPLGVAPGTDSGTATVEFLIDKDGKVRLPRIKSASDPAFGYAAVQTVAHWLFEAPRAGDKTTITRVQVSVSFERENGGGGVKTGGKPLQ
ncbi:TonB family protein [Termitidicoccus mucosus]|uniref:TonB family protein n=1 Tax=Termitidicoccus mucosus TaxID=1184151 RepID=UPI002FEE5171